MTVYSFKLPTFSLDRIHSYKVICLDSEVIYNIDQVILDETKSKNCTQRRSLLIVDTPKTRMSTQKQVSEDHNLPQRPFFSLCYLKANFAFAIKISPHRGLHALSFSSALSSADANLKMPFQLPVSVDEQEAGCLGPALNSAVSLAR